MWQKLSLRARINFLLALGLTLGLAINIARLVVEAGPRVRAEDQSVIRLAREFVETIVSGLNEAPDPDARLNQIVHDLSRLRHVSITRQGDTSARERSGNGDDERSPPAWFIALVHPETSAVSVPITVHGKPQSLVITSHPNDEMAEIWDGIITQLAVSSYLFTLRAHAGALMRLSEDGRAPGADALRKHGTAIMEQINALQQFNRRILEKLRPVGLAELGLREALGVLLRLWRESRPDVTIDANIACAPGETGEVSDLTVYRIVQEALTNAFRHADATSVSVTVEQAAGMHGNRGCALVRVSDNGRGLAPDHKSGFGLIGMRERILALGGTLNVVSGDGGVTVEAIVPHGSNH